MKTIRTFYRFLFYVIGQFIVSVGVVLSVKAMLGVSTGSAVPFVVNKFYPRLTLGIGTSMIMIILLLIQIILLRKDFKPINLFQIVLSFLYGYLIDFSMSILFWLNPATYAARFIVLLLSVILQGLGIAIYVNTKIMPMPPEGFLLALTSKLPKLSLGTAKNILDLTLVFISALLSLVFLKTIVGIREGTVILALGVGRVIGVCQKTFGRRLTELYFGSVPEEAAPEAVPETAKD